MKRKPQPNRRKYLETLRRMTPSQRAQKAFELSAQSRRLFLDGLHKRFPDATAEEFRRLVLARLAKCHNRNY